MTPCCVRRAEGSRECPSLICFQTVGYPGPNLVPLLLPLPGAPATTLAGIDFVITGSTNSAAVSQRTGLPIAQDEMSGSSELIT